MQTQLADISHVIQLAIAPVFLLTAVATMINAMNTRLGRIVDRRRVVQDRIVMLLMELSMEVAPRKWSTCGGAVG